MTPPGFLMSLHDIEGVPDQCKFIDIPGLVGLPRIELGSHTYKVWALTNKQQSQENQEPSS